MSRPVSRAAVRYGLPDTAETYRHLRTARLVDADGYPLEPARPVLAALARAGRPDLALASLADLLEALRVRDSTTGPAGPAIPGDGSPADRGVADTDGDATAGDAELRQALVREPALRARLIGVLGDSTVLSEHLVQHPQSWRLLRSDPVGAALLRPAETRQILCGAVHLLPDQPGPALTGPPAVAALRCAYRDRLLMIAAYDLAPGVDDSQAEPGLPAVSRALTALADALLQTALAVTAADLGPDQVHCRLAVIAMGKTGARELNYLSDVDVIFVADHPADTDAGADTGADAGEDTGADAGSVTGAGRGGRSKDESRMLRSATALAAGLMRICGQVAWEVDANLRPEGAAGTLVRTPDSLRAYYRRWAATWEFQALLKARPAAGDARLGREFLEIVRPGVWSAAGRESFVDDVQAMRRRVEDNIPAAERDRELKLGSGGLRDVEFAVQLLQLVHGRNDVELRVGGTLSAIDRLSHGGYIGRQDGADLADAYVFLRRAEHRLQLQRLRRTHLLPDNDADREWLARADGYLGTGTESAAAVFVAERRRHAATVRRLHEKLFYRPLLNAVAAVGASDAAPAVDEASLSPQAAAERLAALGFSPQNALRHLQALTSGVSRRAAIQRALLPVLLDVFSRGPDPDAGLLGYRQVSDALAETPWYLRLLRDEGTVALRLAELLSVSKLVAELLPRAPEVLRLLDDDALVKTDPATVAAALRARARRAAEAAGSSKPAQAAVAAARSARRHELLRLACADVLGMLDVHQVAAALTSVAEATVQAAIDAAWAQVSAERGSPIRGRLAVIGMGRLGGAELGYGSDADVMYVAAVDADVDDPDPVLRACSQVADLAGRLLAASSPDPALSLDADLRPEGRNGPLVRTLTSFRSYWESYAAPWERQALLRARPIAGDAELGAEFVRAADEFRYPAGGLPQGDVVEIRRIKARVDTERLPKGADPTTHTKLGRGGLSDVEWTVQLLQLQHAGRLPQLRTTSTTAALAAAADTELLTAADAEKLRTAWDLASRTRNGLMLVKGKPDDQIPRQGRVLAALVQALGYPAGTEPGEFVDRYRRVARRARRVVDRIFEGH